MMKEKGFQFAEVTHEIKPVAGGPKLIHLTFNVERRAEGQDPDDRVRRATRTSATATLREPDEGEQGAVVRSRSSPAAAPTRKRSSKKTPSGSWTTTATAATSRRRSASPTLNVLEDSEDKQDALGRAADPGRRRARATASASSTSPATRSSRARCCGRSSRSRRATTTARKRSGRASRRRRRCTAPAATWSSPGYPDYKSSATSPTRQSRQAPAALAAVPDKPAGPADRRRHDADSGGQAVLRQPHHVCRQHDDARQRHPARDAAVRERRLQHRGAEVQHPPAEPARLLQGARGPAQGRHVRQDARRRQARSTSS